MKEKKLRFIIKKLFLFIIISLLSFCLSRSFGLYLSVYADDKMVAVLNDANRYIEENFGKKNYYPESITVKGIIYYPNEDIYDKYKIISYWNEKNLDSINNLNRDRVKAVKEDKEYEENDIIYRYLGYDREGKLIHSPNFPADKMDLDPSKAYIKKIDKERKKVWEEIFHKKDKIKQSVISNIEKSLFVYIGSEIKRFNLYRKTDNVNLYIKNWKNYLLKEFENAGSFEEKVDIIMLPAKNSMGLALIRRSTGYYISLPLKYQEKTDATLKIIHMAVEKKGNDFVVAKGFHAINDSSEKKFLKEGGKYTINSRKSKAYKCIGHSYFDNFEEYKKNSQDKINISLNVDFFDITYIYKHFNDKPVLIFYYLKNIEKSAPEADGQIKISSEKFDVSDSVPTGENVDIEVFVKDKYLTELYWRKENKTSEISVFYAGKNTKNKPEKIGNIEIDLEYNKLDYYRIYSLDSAKIINQKLKYLSPVIIPDKETSNVIVKQYVKNIIDPILDKSSIIIDHNKFEISIEKLQDSDEVYDLNPEEKNKNSYSFSIIIQNNENTYISDDLSSKILAEINNIFHFHVRNDFVSIGNQVISSDENFIDKAPEPSVYKPRPIILKELSYKIEDIIKNGNGKTTGKLSYKLVKGTGKEFIEYDIFGNDIFVHTPTVNISFISDESAYDQRVKKDNDFPVVPLDHIVQVDISTKGVHKLSKGYGDSDYEKYIASKIIKIPFDAYVSLNKEDIKGISPDISHFVGKDMETHIPVNAEKIYFKPASWVKEGKYKINTYAVAKNSNGDFYDEKNANLSFENYVASQEININVTGRIFDFFVEKVYDPAYLSNDNRYFTSGLKNKESKPRNRYLDISDDEAEQNILPVMIGKSSTKDPVLRQVKLGYPFLFSVKTMGSFILKDDVVIANTKFYHIDEKGKIDEEIILCYRKDNDIIKIGSEEDTLSKMIVYKDLAGAKGIIDIKKTENYLKNRFFNYISLAEKSKDDFIKKIPLSSILRPEEYKTRTQNPVLAYNPGYWILSYPFRTFIGQENNLPLSVDKYQAGMSIQRWQGMYSLPESTIIFKKDSNGNIDFGNQIKNGSIGVVFDIGLARENNINGPELTYSNGLYNGWEIEGYKKNQFGYELLEGTVILYSVNQNSDEDRISK